jgi:hypothetical protein
MPKRVHRNAPSCNKAEAPDACSAGGNGGPGSGFIGLAKLVPHLAATVDAWREQHRCEPEEGDPPADGQDPADQADPAGAASRRDRQVRRAVGVRAAGDGQPADDLAADHWRTPEAGLLGRVYAYLADYVVLPEPVLLAVSAWVLAGYLADLWDRFPHLGITSPEPRFGKTRLLELLEPVCRQGWLLTNVSPASLYRRIALDRPTLLLDEAQCLGRRGSEASEVLRELFCGGISKGAKVSRCVGLDHAPTDFPIYCPKALALIGSLDGALADRSLPVPMKRKGKGDVVKRCRIRQAEKDGAALAEDLGRWACGTNLRRRVRQAYDRLEPFAIDNDRMADLLVPLQVVVLEFGGEDGYPMQVLRTYAEELEARGREVERQSPGVRLLAACRDVFLGGKDRLAFVATGELLARLHERKEEPWATWNRGKPLGDEALAGLLRAFDVRPGRNKDQTARGYHAADFADAWLRYLRPMSTNPSNPSNPSSPSRRSAAREEEAEE